MVRALEHENCRSRFLKFRGMNKEDSGSCPINNGNSRRAHSQSMVIESSSPEETEMEEIVEDSRSNRRYASKSEPPVIKEKIGAVLERELPAPRSRLTSDSAAGVDKETHQRNMDMMKEKFAKLLLGEDMSGGGKGVSSALALSNAITNLAASVFGEQRKLEPMAPENRSRWKREIEWLLSVTDHVVEFSPSQQKGANGVTMEIMTTKQRTDLQMNVPALKKLDNMLIDCLDNFKDQHEFYYVKKDADESEKSSNSSEKWWLPVVKVPPNGLSEVTKLWLQFQKDSVNQVLKAAMAINAQILSEMEIPENYIESLPKNGRASLGDAIYKGITVEYFDPEQFLNTMDLSSEHKIVDLKNRVEASIVIWRRKMTNKDTKSHWGSAVSTEKRELFEERAETILLILKQRFPGVSQSQLDISKIQYNKDVGHSILESYSRILESLAHTVLSRIEDVLYADSLVQTPSLANKKRNPLIDVKIVSTKFPNASEEIEKLNAVGTPPSMTLSDFMGWTSMENPEADMRAKEGAEDEETKETTLKFVGKLANLALPKKSYLETLGGLRSPTARH